MQLAFGGNNKLVEKRIEIKKMREKLIQVNCNGDCEVEGRVDRMVRVRRDREDKEKGRKLLRTMWIKIKALRLV